MNIPRLELWMRTDENRCRASISEAIRLMNGTVLTYERAHAFMAFYGQQFALGKPIIRIDTLPHKPGSSAIMIFGESRMSYGSGLTDGAAKRDCYLKGAHKVESFDPEIWKLFVADETAKAQSQTTQERPTATPASTSTRPRVRIPDPYAARSHRKVIHLRSSATFSASVVNSSTVSASNVGLRFEDVEVPTDSSLKDATYRSLV